MHLSRKDRRVNRRTGKSGIAKGTQTARPVSWSNITVLIGVFLFIGITSESANAWFGQSPSQTNEPYSLVFPESPDLGGELFIQKGCIRCHAILGEGGQIGPDLGRLSFRRNLSDLTAAMWNHAPTMSRQMRTLGLEEPHFEPGEIRAITSFLYYVNFGDPRGDPETGAMLFTSKECVQCHIVAGEGGTAGPSLDLLQAYVSPVVIAQRMWNHGQQMLGTMRDMGIEVPVFSGTEMTDLIAFLRVAGRVGPGSRRFSNVGDARNGMRIFRVKGCTSCHSVMGEGGKTGPDLAESDIGATVTELIALMWNHWPQMLDQMEQAGLTQPVFTEIEMTDLLAFLYAIHYSGKPGEPSRGEDLFDEKQCRSCHAVRGVGALTGPDLAESEAARSLENGIRLLWNHAVAMEEPMLASGVAWPSLSGSDVSDLLAFIRRSRRNEN